MADEPRPIYQFYDTAFECPHCGQRLEFADQIDEDEDGPIFEGQCRVHGEFLVQAANEDTEDEEADSPLHLAT